MRFLPFLLSFVWCNLEIQYWVCTPWAWCNSQSQGWDSSPKEIGSQPLGSSLSTVATGHELLSYLRSTQISQPLPHSCIQGLPMLVIDPCSTFVVDVALQKLHASAEKLDACKKGHSSIDGSSYGN
ncbi:hypothetical protein E2542_SST02873 [Spatholobus suberectus]|nr:hypothetical protein E2542_SST02873 [Spatholobus suberectus]